jgi:outer membrane protein OmpA-like peptidoglycan-associated protein
MFTLRRRLFALTVAGILPLFGLAQSASGQAGGQAIKAVSYQMGSKSRVNLAPVGQGPQASGEAEVDAKKGVTSMDISVANMPEPTSFGAEFLTYVVWVVSPDGRASNVGELELDQSRKGKLKATTPLQTFSLFVTAEPYFAVRQPSELLVLENELRKDTKGRIVVVNDYPLVRRTQYAKLGNPLALKPDLKTVPLAVYEARNAVDIAKSRGADKYAPEIFSKADGGLQLTEAAVTRKQDRKEIIARARMTVQSSEDARALAVQRQEEERIAKEKADAAAQAQAAAEAKAAAEAAEAKRRTDEEARRQAEVAAAREAQLKAEADAKQARLKAEADANEARMKAEAELAAMKAKAEADALKAREDAAKADAERAKQAAEALRSQLLQQFNRILETKDTPRGLVITMGDVLFDTGKYDLRPPTREMLSKLTGILVAHNGLRLEVEGHTDATGSDETNQRLSEQRAGTVRDYLVKQGLDNGAITAKGFGETMPVADNTTAAGRQKNRRVELIVSGEVIGVKLGGQ